MAGDELQQGIELFNQGRFFDAHEVLEDVWRRSSQENKKFFQGLVQVAVAFHHHSTGNLVGMRSVLRRALTNLELAPLNFAAIDLGSLQRSLTAWLAAAESGTPFPQSLPRMGRSGKGF